jgi:hypothetical protein
VIGWIPASADLKGLAGWALGQTSTVTGLPAIETELGARISAGSVALGRRGGRIVKGATAAAMRSRRKSQRALNSAGRQVATSREVVDSRPLDAEQLGDLRRREDVGAS